LRIRDAAGTVLLTRMMKPGDELTPPDREGLSMFIGSAGALEVMVDGKRAPTLGPLGAVRRDVPLDPDRLLAGNVDSPRPAMIAPAPPANRQVRPGSGG
jgi:cytoskeleton protein RodZ